MKKYKDFVTFAMNFPPNFIEDCFSELGPMMVEHLSNKWSEAYQLAGPYGAMTRFYASLDGRNTILLEQYIAKLYKEEAV